MVRVWSGDSPYLAVRYKGSFWGVCRKNRADLPLLPRRLSDPGSLRTDLRRSSQGLMGCWKHTSLRLDRQLGEFLLVPSINLFIFLPFLLPPSLRFSIPGLLLWTIFKSFLIS